ncbi:dipeptidase PepV [Tepidibacter aestuarii]|uniref:dipeptidase PepV n=1 Tax=Tepidibacter aestuarii TaxID=2925782 RepID=UPI002096A88A|nr:dipeptidase PepV [Tepidibacter aestuarii]CAH2211789.1 succinyl-diaminopimelate desuccinylase [Tepidibacter aestuarii]
MNIDLSVENIKDDLIKSIQEIVRIPSVISDKTDKFPFGENIDNALRKTLDLCESLGFKTYYKDGYYGYAEIGEGDEMIGILGHLDVVPEGEANDWKHDPYGAVIEDNKLYGRGTQDDKGPTIAAIYAVKALMNLDVKFNKRIRFIFGTDEENLWGGISKYVENEEIPSYGFTPDSVFPMINAEKGLLQANIKCKNLSNIKLNGGNAYNAVPDRITYFSDNLDKLSKELDRLHFEYMSDSNSLTVIGKASHACNPHYGINAISRLCIALNNIGIKSKSIEFIANVIGETYNGDNIIPNCNDEASGKLTLNVGKINIDENTEQIGLDIRIPVTVEKDMVVNSLKEKLAQYNLEYEEYDYLKSIYVPADHFLIKTLQKVYEEETGLDSTPLSSGGATYARAIDNCVAFGAVFPNKPKVEHQANEYIEIDDLLKSTKIYAKAVYELTK